MWAHRTSTRSPSRETARRPCGLPRARHSGAGSGTPPRRATHACRALVPFVVAMQEACTAHRAPPGPRRDVRTRDREYGNKKGETRPRHEPTISSLQSPLVFAFRPALVARCTRMGLTHSSSRSLRLRCARPRARTRLPPPSRSTCACATARAHVRSHHHSRGGYQKPVRLRFCFFMALTSASCVSSKVRARFSRDSR